jgi:hypothetical protein
MVKYIVIYYLNIHVRFLQHRLKLDSTQIKIQYIQISENAES